MLELYVLETCPYSRKVMEYFSDNDIEYVKHVITEPEAHKKLLELGGKDQVPFLYDTNNDKGLYESDEIIEYVQNKE